jgi:hypothetical protein
MKYIKIFEEYNERERGFIRVPPDFEKIMRGVEDDTKIRSKYYSKPINQIKIDLFYEIKLTIREYLEDIQWDEKDRNEKLYLNKLKNSIKEILYKFSEGKYANIKKEDVPKVKEMIMGLIKEKLPYDEVDYTYDLRKKILELLDEFILKLKESNLFDEEKGFVWEEVVSRKFQINFFV